VFFDLQKHCVIVEIDENQHTSYTDVCECARISEIVGSIGGRSVIFIRYNPDKIKNKAKEVVIKQEQKLELLIKTIKEELQANYDIFSVKLIQLFYNDDNDVYQNKKYEYITHKVCV
jgi:hypothetical protein